MSHIHPEDFLSREERAAFLLEFEKDLNFVQLFFLLFNKTFPFKKIDLVWAEGGPAGRVGLHDLTGTLEALRGPCSHLIEGVDPNPDPLFCRLVNDHGRHMAESCALADQAAQERIRQTGHPDVYRCHAGLTDIAVPVICDGRLVATLFTGQVLREPPTEARFTQIRKDVSGLDYVDLAELEAAYWKVPVVSHRDVESITRIMELFAEHLAASWKRLSDSVREQRRRSREISLLRNEFACMVLDRTETGPEAVRLLAEKVGFTRPPSRVLVVRLESEREYHSPSVSFDLAVAQAVHAVEEICDTTPNVSAAYLRNRGICVFSASREGPGRQSAELAAYRLARAILASVSGCCDLRARVGIGQMKRRALELVDSYNEAFAALANSTDAIAPYRQPPASLDQLHAAMENLCRAVSGNRLSEANAFLASLPQSANRHLGEDLEAHRQFFSSAFHLLSFCAQNLGCDVSETMSEFRGSAGVKMGGAGSIFQLHGAFLQSAEGVLKEVRQLYSGRREKLVDRACRIIDRKLAAAPVPEPVTLPGIAQLLRVSPAHLSRTFKRISGATFERYVLGRRIQLARRLLLEPFLSVSEVADKCGFSESTYFAKAFRKVAGCAPSEYRRDPSHFVEALP